MIASFHSMRGLRPPMYSMKFDHWGNILVVSYNKFSIFEAASLFRRKVVYEFQCHDDICQLPVEVSCCGRFLAGESHACHGKVDLYFLQKPCFDDYESNNTFCQKIFCPINWRPTEGEKYYHHDFSHHVPKGGPPKDTRRPIKRQRVG